jgi:hypothetical protein
MRMWWLWILAMAMPLAGGCHSSTTPASPAAKPVLSVAQLPGNNPSLDAAPAERLIFQVEIFLLAVPSGAISGNEEFWKRIDEQTLSPDTYDLLYKNGIRVGEAPLAELQHFAKFMDGIVPIQRFMVTGTEVQNMHIEMKTNLPEQMIMYIDRNHTLVGDTYGRCDNIMNISFEPAFRKPGQLRLTLCPMVRVTRKQLRFTSRNTPFEDIVYVNPEAFYDLNFKVDLPTEEFLIVSPSPQASLSGSLGNAFLTKDGPTDKLEQVLIVRSTPLRMQLSTP